MVSRFFAIFLASAFVVSGAAKKTTATARGENDDLILNVTIYIDSAAVKQALGDDLGGHYIVADVKVEPKSAPARQGAGGRRGIPAWEPDHPRLR